MHSEHPFEELKFQKGNESEVKLKENALAPPLLIGLKPEKNPYLLPLGSPIRAVDLSTTCDGSGLIYRNALWPLEYCSFLST